MVSIMIKKHTYKASVKDIMDKWYEMFRGKNRGNKSDCFNRPEDVQDSDTDGWTGLVLSEEEWVECEREPSLSFIKITQSVIYWK
jgi:hypothetical protein